jgi:RNA polymerase sigma-70 factor (ECF subfamily)
MGPSQQADYMTGTDAARHTPPEARFAATRWTLIAAATVQEAGSARRALIELCLRYWYPVYSYVRGCGHAPEIAQDISRGFFEHLLARRLSLADLRARGRFREYLLDALVRHLGGDWQNAADAGPVPEFERPGMLAELEARHRQESTPGLTPDQAYQRGYALEVLGNALMLLRREAQEAGRSDMFETLSPWLSAEPEPGRFEELAAALSMRPLAVVVALKRLRQRFREIAEAELSETVSSAADLEAERDALARALGLDASDA